MTYPPPAAGGPSTSNDGYGGGGGMSYGHMGSMPHMGSMQHMGSMASMGSMGHVNPLQPPVQNMGSMQHMGSMQRGSMHSGSGAGSEMHVPGPGMGSGPYGRRMSMVASEYDNLSRRTSTSGHVDMGGPMSGEGAWRVCFGFGGSRGEAGPGQVSGGPGLQAPGGEGPA